MGIPMGTPYFKIERDFVKQGGVALSSNYALYADQSTRVMTILAGFSPHQEVYSIDECFLGMAGITGLSAIGQAIRQKVVRWTGLPVCVGFGPSKTLAKLANHVAKKKPEWSGVCDLVALSAAEQDALVGGLAVGEVWGVGRKIDARLAEMGITTVRQLRDANPARIRAAFGVVLERTVSELNGVSCLLLEEAAPSKQQIMVSRSFGSPAFERTELQSAVSTFIGRAAEKLRKQASCTSMVMVFIHTSPFRTSEPQYSRSITVPLATATDDTLLLTQAALAGLDAIYRPGYAFAKAGVMLSALVDRDRVPQDLFASPLIASRNLMTTLDRVNAKFGRGMLTTAAALSKGSVWAMRQDRRSPKYTTDWGGLIRVRG